MDISEFENIVAAYMNRPVAYFNVNGVDLILRAANNAKRFAQRSLDFELCRTAVNLSVSLTTGGLLSAATRHDGSTTALSVNKIERGWIQYGSGANDFRPAELVSRQRFAKRLEAAWEGNTFDPARQPTPTVTTVSNLPTIIRQGNVMYVWPNDSSLFGAATSTTIALDVLEWMTDYGATTTLIMSGSTTPASSGTYTTIGIVNSNPLWFSATRGLYVWYNSVSSWWEISTTPGTTGTSYWKLASSITPIGTYAAVTYTGTPAITAAVFDSQSFTDFFLTDCLEWMQWKVIQELNGFLKDSERVTVSAALLAEAWRSVVAWNESLCDGGNEDVTLD